MMISKLGLGVGGLAMALVVGVLPIKAEESKGAPSQSTIEHGGRTFLRYCALCHGLDGRGSGPLAEALAKTPPDLTRIAERNGGTYPKDKVAGIIERGGVVSHGMMAMLAWGKVFNEELGPAQQAEIIQSLTAYVEVLQEKK
jgi:mono/diheme cytochrome c family protein